MYAHLFAWHEMPAAFLTRTLQLFAQLPHAVALVVAVSQPVLPATQWPKPLLHAKAQAPAAQDEAAAFAVLLHAAPHFPQFAALVRGLLH